MTEEIMNALTGEVYGVWYELGVTGMTVTQVMGCGVQRGTGEKYRGVEMDATLLPKVKMVIRSCEKKQDARKNSTKEGKSMLYFS